MLRQAKERGAVCAVLPECCDIGWAAPDALLLAQPIPGKISDFFCMEAEKYGLWIAAGITEREDGLIYNTAVLISDTGRLIGKHRKINILSDVEDMYSAGDRLMVYDTPFGKAGMTICADNAAGSLVLGESLARMGAGIILSPCSWAVRPEELGRPYGDTWLKPYGLLSELYGTAVVGVSNVGRVTAGKWKDYRCIGNSIAVSSGGDAAVLSYGEYAEEIGLFDYHPKPAPILGTSLSSAVESKRLRLA